MNCTYCEDRLSDYLEGALDAVERGLVEEHLKSCLVCNELLDGVRTVMHWGKDLPAQLPAPWLASRIVSNTPHVIRVTWRDWMVGVWKNVCEPRFALAVLTSTLMLGWMGSPALMEPVDRGPSPSGAGTRRPVSPVTVKKPA